MRIDAEKAKQAFLDTLELLKEKYSLNIDGPTKNEWIALRRPVINSELRNAIEEFFWQDVRDKEI